jgi:NAD(P)H-dependent FMN reductase
MNTSKNLLIVHHTQSGDTKKMTDAIIRGSEHKNLNIRSLSALKASSNDLFWSDGVLFGTPENFGYMSGAMKFFFDEIYYECLEKVSGKPYSL